MYLLDLFKKKSDKSLIGVAASYNVNTLGYRTSFMNPDVVLQKERITLDKYSQLLNDAHVWSCVQSRKSGVLSLEYAINRGADESFESEFVNNVFKSLDLRQLISDCLNAVLYGFSPLEIYWRYDGGYLVPKKIIGKPAWWFQFNDLGLLELINSFNSIPQNKFIVVQNNASYTNPYGEPLLSKCYYPVIFKRGTMKLWSRFVEKYGMPFLTGKIPTGKGQQQAQDLFDTLAALSQDGIAVTEEDINIAILDSMKSGSSDLFLNFIHFCNTEISKAILSQTLTTEQGDTGSYAMSQTHLQVRKDVVDADKKLVEDAINKLIELIITMNFGEIEVPYFEMFESTDVDLNLANRDEILNRCGVQFTKKYYQENYGFNDTDFDIKLATQPQFAEPDEIIDIQDEELPEQAALKQIQEIGLNEFENAFAPVVKKVVKLINVGKSYDEIQESLLDLYPKLNTTQIEDVIARGILISNLGGQVSVSKRKRK